MTQFFAILKDSFREAVDGFVIYVMLGLSALTMLIVGSMSFTPAPPQEAFDKIVSGRDFSRIFQDRGRSRSFNTISLDSQLSASDVQPAGSGYKLRVTVTAKPLAGTITDDKGTRADLSRGDSFRQTVALWAKRPETIKAAEMLGKQQGGGKQKGAEGNKAIPDIEISLDRAATVEEQKAITDADMAAFLQNQFAVAAGMDVTATRITTGVAEPTYAFDVTTTGGSGVRGWPHTTKIFFGSVTISRQATLGKTLYIIENRIINGIGAAVALLIGVIITAFFVPNLLRKGSVDLIISKPIGRTQLLVYKYIGGLTFIFLISAFTIGGVWLVVALRSGFWDPTFLILIPIMTFTFAILYSVSVLLGVLTRSPIVAMLGTLAFMFLVWLAGWGKTIVDLMQVEGDEDEMPRWLVAIINAANAVLPRYRDLDVITSKLIIDGTLTPAEAPFESPLALVAYPSWSSTIGISLAFIAVMLALACWRFSKRDY